ncbi:MAG: MATE family efflux transporter [Immundisolibacteraceae bacterium]|nr:MATE family efflux transporter [Immundisolibacteraceae bacterium]
MSRLAITPSRIRRIFSIALPIIAAMLSQSLLNLVDIGMVGQLGDAPLAAVGLSSFALFTFQSLILGLSTGVQAMAARRKGEGKNDETAVVLNGGLLLALICAPPLSLLLVAIAPFLMPLLSADPAVVNVAIPYFQVRAAAVLFLCCNYCFRGYWNAVDLSRLYMWTLLLIHGTNIFLNYVLIFGHFGAPAMGATGAGIASSIAMVVGTLCYFILARRHARPAGFLKKLPPRHQLITLIRQSLPTGVSQTSVMAGNVTLYWIIGKVGTAELAAASVLLNITTVAILPGFGLAIGCATLVGQALGRGDSADAQRWVNESLVIGVLTLGLLGSPMWIMPELLLGLFLQNPETVALAATPMRIIGVTVILEGIKRVYQHALLGAGDPRRPMQIQLTTQWLLFIPSAWLAGLPFGLGLLGIWIVQEIHRLLQALLFRRLWRRGQWRGVSL